LGTYAIQIAKHYGAEVTGVCSTNNIALVKSLGADKVIDYTKEDFTKNGELYDIIFDTVGKRSYSACKKSLKQKGMYLSAVLDFNLFMHMIWTSIFGSKKARSSATGMLPVKERLNYFMELKELLRTAKIKTVLDTSYPLSKIAEAHKYVEKGHKKGSVVISI
ncbi:MAG: NAD(P)-dependent alcohol dehydrogenase, partial [Saprospiraceae bacterium]|nr:NAD(P)-dependent alcohol dehydrogenase [Saprospiraceae bacterium]